MSRNIIEKAMEYAIRCHESTNHMYGDGEPYKVHLQMVFDTAKRFIYLIPKSYKENVLAACWVHDVIEDCRQTYTDVKNATNEQVAELAYALTNEKGRNRKERASDKYYKGIRDTPGASFIKVCDRIANYHYSLQHGSSQISMYDKEMALFVSKIWDRRYKELFDYLVDEVTKSHLTQ